MKIHIGMHGYYYDTETGLYYLQSRYYNPEVARFISEDTVRGVLEDPLSLNLYTYVHNNPLKYYDPDGHVPIPLITGVIGGAVSTAFNFFGDLLDDGQINRGWKSYAGSFVEGAVIGAGFGALGPGVGTVKTMVAGFGLGFTGNSANQFITNGKVDLKQATISGITTGVGAGVFSIGGPIQGSGFERVGQYAVKGFTVGVIGNTTKQAGEIIAGYRDEFDTREVVLSGVIGSVVTPIVGTVTEKVVAKWGTVPKSAKIIQTEETKASIQTKSKDVIDTWNEYLGKKQTNINPLTGKPDANRIFSSNGTKSIRFGIHEMSSMGTSKFHYHQEAWKYDPSNNIVNYYNRIHRIK